MAFTIKPRRGKKSTMTNTSKAGIVLQEGEMFIEFDDNPDVKQRHARIKIGDGKTTYQNLPYALGDSIKDENVDFIEDPRTSFSDIFADFVTGISLNTMIPLIKKCIYLLHTAEQALESDVYKKNEVYTKTQSNNRFALKDDVYTKSDIEDNYMDRAYMQEHYYDKDHSLSMGEIQDGYFDKSFILNNYYDIGNVYNKGEIENRIYSKVEVDNIDSLAFYYNKAEIDDMRNVLIRDITNELQTYYYTRTQVDNAIVGLRNEIRGWVMDNYYTKQQCNDNFVHK